MSKRPRRNHSPAFKAKVVLAAVKGEKMLAELAQQYDVRLCQIQAFERDCLHILNAKARACLVAVHLRGSNNPTTRSHAVSQVQPEARSPDRKRGVQGDGEDAAKRHRQPERHTGAQKHWNEQKHRQ